MKRFHWENVGGIKLHVQEHLKSSYDVIKLL